MRYLAPTLARIVFLFLPPIVAACSTSGPAYRPPSPDTAATVEMSGFSFVPSSVRIKTGETVEWRNNSLFTHTVTDDPQRDPQRTALPPGAMPFDSGRIAAGETFRHSFTAPGTYRYKCIPHEDFGMVGTVIVEPGS